VKTEYTVELHIPGPFRSKEDISDSLINAGINATGIKSAGQHWTLDIEWDDSSSSQMRLEHMIEAAFHSQASIRSIHPW
jgi:hypothetical protein